MKNCTVVSKKNSTLIAFDDNSSIFIVVEKDVIKCGVIE